MSAWRLEQLTHGSDRGRFHTHSYYDIGVFDSASRRLVGHCLKIAERPPMPEDEVEIGVIDTEDGTASWVPIGESRAWSWQQGPMAQWIPGQSRVIWNDRDGERFVTRVHDLDTGERRTLARPSYAIDPGARFTLGLNMARLDAVRPGYGYVGGAGAGAGLNNRRPRNDGVWRQNLDDGGAELVLSLDRAVRFFYARLGLRTSLRHRRQRYRYWFNHVKIAPDGQRFTVKLRYRRAGRDSAWNDSMGVSLTCNVDGSDLRLLASATSHVIWLDDDTLYLWRGDGFYLYADTAPRGQRVRQLAPGLINQNVHLRYFPGSRQRFVLDTPYREDVDLLVADDDGGNAETIARFNNHRPANGQYRCDLHPCPSPDGHKIVVTSLHDGGRQIYLLRHTGD